MLTFTHICLLLLLLSILWLKMAEQGIHDVLTVCGITNQNIRQQIIDNEGFTAIRDFGEMEGDSDVTDMATGHI